ncbi:MAG: S41 family peptidase [Pyrinomonadaceae bacterium]|nr:S41 family peptidase [Pyrinomonadaceae bacterium]
MNRVFITIGIMLVGIGAVVGGMFGRLPQRTNTDAGLNPKSISQDYGEALELIDSNYVNDIKHEDVLDSSVQSMLWTLDPHSSFFTRAEFKKLYEEQQSQFYGIGVSIYQHRDGVYVQSVIPETPADKEGLRFGDKIVEVEGKDATKWSSSEVSKNVRGEKGTPVNIKVERLTAKNPVPFKIYRGGVPLPSIRNHFMLENKVGYVGLSGGFQETTAKELDFAIENLKKEGMESLVLDLRGNRGGLLPQAIEVVSRFIPRGQTVVSVKGRSRYMSSRDLRAVGGTIHEFPLVVLIDGSSASASEIVAGAVQDYGRGLVVGSESFGKGLVQKVFPLPYGTGLTLTTGRYYTPYGRSLQRDYSSGSIYDYFTHNDGATVNGKEDDLAESESKPEPAGKPVKTAGGRTFYGGRGIEPDLKAPGLLFNDARYRVSESTFFFTRQLVAGKISGFESYKTEKQTFVTVIKPDDVRVDDALFNRYVEFTVKDPKFGLTKANIADQYSYARSRLREQIATARFSSEAGTQVLLENDPQVLKAVDAIPQAKKLTNTIMASR